MLWRWLRLTELLSYSARRWKSDDGGLLNLHSSVSKCLQGSMSAALESLSCSLKGFCGRVESFEGQFFCLAEVDVVQLALTAPVRIPVPAPRSLFLSSGKDHATSLEAKRTMLLQPAIPCNRANRDTIYRGP